MCVIVKCFSIVNFVLGMAALCMAMLVDRGHLDYEQKVVHYWPEFGQNGKENVTVKMLLHHEVGALSLILNNINGTFP